jgi:prevent-host-death family protein
MSAVCIAVRIRGESAGVHRCYSRAVDRLGVRDLRNNTAAAVRRAEGGERIVITVAGRPAAQLGPIETSGATTLDDLAARGLVELPRTRDRSAPAAAVALWPGFRLDRLVRDIRGR